MEYDIDFFGSEQYFLIHGIVLFGVQIYKFRFSNKLGIVIKVKLTQNKSKAFRIKMKTKKPLKRKVLFEL